MEDNNLIANLYPLDRYATIDRALFTARRRENRKYHFRAENGTENGDCGLGSGEKEEEVSKQEKHLRSECIQLCFDHQRKNRHGFLIGSNKNCDIVLPTEPGFSSVGKYQCLITFDSYGRLILRDLREPDTAKIQRGTIVTYDGEGELPRCGFTWILSGEPFTEKRMEIWFHHRIRFLLVVASHDLDSMSYIRRVVRFHNSKPLISDQLWLQQAREFHDLLSSTSASASPLQDEHLHGEPILVDDMKIGDGGQAVVKRVWDVSTGLQYASKEPLGLKERHWRCFKREAELLKQLRHSNIVRCMYITEVPKRRAILEYLPLGSLSDQAKKQSISSSENLQVLIQGLAALCFLHHRDKPIAHRDIKPDNILVHSRSPLHIKLSDFGLSKTSQQDLKTYCGTEGYMAPEIQCQETYDESVDIWSLGLVALKYAHGFPTSKVMTGVAWAEKITEHLKEKIKTKNCPVLSFLQQHMLLIDPEERSWARRCSMAAAKLEAPGCCAQRALNHSVSYTSTEDDDLTSTPDKKSSGEEKPCLLSEGVDEETIVENCTKDTDIHSDNQTVHKQNTSEATITESLSSTLQSPTQTTSQSTNVTLSSSSSLSALPKSLAISRKRRHRESHTSTSPSRHAKRFKLKLMPTRPFAVACRSRVVCSRSLVEFWRDSWWVLPKVGKELDFSIMDFFIATAGWEVSLCDAIRASDARRRSAL